MEREITTLTWNMLKLKSSVGYPCEMYLVMYFTIQACITKGGGVANKDLEIIEIK